MLTAWAILLVSVGRPGTFAQQPDQPGGEGAPVVVVTGPVVRVWEPTRGGAPSTVGLPTPHHAYEEEEEERERPPPVFVRAQPVPLSEPQGTGWVPMLPGGGGWLSQPHPPRYPPPTSVVSIPLLLTGEATLPTRKTWIRRGILRRLKKSRELKTLAGSGSSGTKICEKCIN